MVFDKQYSNLYDLFYREKDYPLECDLIEKVFKENRLSPRTILDLGCGTGGHALPLSKRGYRVTGVDRSARMLEIAGKKAAAQGLAIDFHEQNVNTLQLDSRFDAVISMFAVIGYQAANHLLEKTFLKIREHLEPEGIFIFDCWYGPAVLKQGPESRIKTLEIGSDSRILRLVTPGLDVLNQVVHINYQVLEIKGSRIVDESKETHTMRFFFARELCYFLEKAGFTGVRFYPFGDLSREPGPSDWNMLVTAV
jgi:SAM-dependent methyltransferase